MKKFRMKCGYVAYVVTIEELANIGGFGICDECNEFALSGYLVPVLNHYMCQSCFEKFDSRANYYKEDIPIENKNAEYYESRIPLDDAESQTIEWDKKREHGIKYAHTPTTIH
jgi:hypothetical protein